MSIPSFNEIIEPNDQTEARAQHLEKLRELVGNVYPNKFERTRISGEEDTITNLVNFAPITDVVKEIKEHVATLAERERPNPELKEKLNAKLKDLGNVRISGRLAVPPRVMGKAAFVHLSDGVERLQIYVRRDDVQGVYNGSEPPALAGDVTSDSGKTESDLKPSARAQTFIDAEVQPPANAGGSDTVNGWEVFGLLDHGDFIGVEGYLFLTNTGELSVHVEKLQFLAKAMLPMPDKMHGIADPELQRRYRYADLIASSLQIEHEGLTTREVFERRAKLISGMRRFLDDHGYIEVETPMLTPKATGAAAEPFETFHKALGIPLYARIAPELYLKRLTVGGFEKVYELNRNFRNEGLSHKHNPEFTMLEFYCAYMDVNGMMDFAEAMIKESVQKATGGALKVEYYYKDSSYENNKPKIINFEKFERISMREAVARTLKKDFPEEFNESLLDDSTFLLKVRFFMRFEMEAYLDHSLKQMTKVGYNLTDEEQFERHKTNWLRASEEALKDNEFNNLLKADKEKLLVYIFEEGVESDLGFVEHSDRIDVTPTFIIDYPKSISPLSKASPENPQIAERFELFINGMECANGFSELNDPQEQYARFVDQMKERESGDAEAMVLDEDYIRALAYGMPPAAGIGIGIDRLVMLLTNKHSIRDVILFPHMRPEKKHIEEQTEN